MQHQKGKQLFLFQLLWFTSSIRFILIKYTGIFYCEKNYWWRIRHVVDEYYTTGYGSGNTWCFTTFFSHLSSFQNPKTRKKALETRKAAYGAGATSLFLLHCSIFRFIHSGIEMIGGGRHHACKLYFTQLNLILILFVE